MLGPFRTEAGGWAPASVLTGRPLQERFDVKVSNGAPPWTFEVPAGIRLWVVGKALSGKSRLLRAISGRERTSKLHAGRW